jgi:thiamine biosynthesis lipoprotein
MTSSRVTDMVMGTVVTMEVVAERRAASDRDAAIARAFAWFREVEAVCTRFDPASELMRLSATHGTPVHVSDILFRAVEFACALAADTDGAFDPAVGRAMHARGFNREYRTGEAVNLPPADDSSGTFRDIELDVSRRTIALRKPVALDLGAVAKGLAVDLAARTLDAFGGFAIDAGGDLFLGGHNANGECWTVGIRDPHADGRLLESVTVSNAAVCTSGGYERRSPHDPGVHHLLDPRSGRTAHGVDSVTVVAPRAMLADGLSTAAFVLGADQGLALLQHTGVEGLIVTSDRRRVATSGFGHVVLSHA